MSRSPLSIGTQQYIGRTLANRFFFALAMLPIIAAVSCYDQSGTSTSQPTTQPQPGSTELTSEGCTHRHLWEYNEDGTVKQYLGCN